MFYAKLSFAIGAALATTTSLAAGSVVLDNTLPGHATNTTLPLVGGTYTIPSSQGFVSSPAGATHNLFFSFQTFNVDSAETGRFTNDQTGTYASNSFSNLISRVTGGTPSTLNGTIDSTAFPKANFWFVNPAGVTIGGGAVLNVPAGLAIGAGDYVSFANGDRWYVIDANASGVASTLSTATPNAFGFLSVLPSSGALAVQGTTISVGGPLTLSAGSGGVSLSSGSSLTTTNNTPGGGSSAGPDLTVTANGGPITLQNSTLTTNNVAEPQGSPTSAAAGGITISGQTVAIHGGSIYSQTLNGANAGSIALTATGSGASAIQMDGGATIKSDASEGNTSIVGGSIVSIANAGSVSLQAPSGGISVTGGSISSQAGDENPSGAGAHAGQAGPISLDAAQTNLNGTLLETQAQPPNTTGAQQDSQGVTHTAALVPAGISLHSSGAAVISGTSIRTLPFGAIASGDISISGGSVSLDSSQVSTRNSVNCGCIGITPSGNAGNINITSAGALSLQNSTLASQTQTLGNAGNVVLTSSGTQGTTDVIRISGGSIGTGSVGGPGIDRGNGGKVTIAGPSVLMTGTSIDTSTVGTGFAGDVSVKATGAAGVGSSQGGTGDALLVTGGTTISASSPSYSLSNGAPAGAITLAATAGSLRVDSGSTVTATAVNQQGGPITLAGLTGIMLDHGTVSSDAQHAGSAGTPQDVSLQSSGPITVTNGSTISSRTSGGAAGNNMVIATSGPVTISGNSSLTSKSTRFGPAGNISVTGGSVHIIGGQITATTSFSAPAGNITLVATGMDNSSGGGPALQVEGGTLISSDASQGAFVTSASSGNILLRADQGTVSVVGVPGTTTADSTTISSSTVSGAGGLAGTVTLTGANVSLDDAVVETTIATHNLLSGTPATISVNASNNVSLTNSLLDARTSGNVAAGSVLVTGGSVSISGGLQPAPFGVSGEVLPANTALFSGSSFLADAGKIQVAATDGPVTVSDATLSTQRNFFGEGGTIAVAGSGVLISGQSLLTANYTTPGGHPGGPGAVAVWATGTTAANDPLQSDLTVATPGVVRIVDSTVTAINNGGLDGNQAGRGEISIGSDAPLGGSNLAQNVIIAGSVVSNDVLAGGRGNDLSIAASRGVWIGQSTISAQTQSSAVSGGQLLISGGNSVAVVGSSIDANDAVDGINAGPVRSESSITINSGATGAIALSDSAITTETSGVNKAGDVLVNGGSVAVTGGLLSASTTAVGNAGSVALTATGSTGVNGAAALQVSGGAQIFSDASKGQSTATNAGYVNLAANNGTVQVGMAGDADSSVLSTSAGSAAGSPGAVTITGKGIDLGDARVQTTAAGMGLQSTRGSIVLNADNGAGLLKVSNSVLDAATSGAQQAGEIDLLGSPIQISNATISSATTGTGPAGAICVGVSCAGAPGSAGAAGTANGAGRMLTAAAGGAAGGVSITDSSLSTSTSTSGAAGDINVSTPGALVLSGSTIASQSTAIGPSAGPVGVINLSGGSVSLLAGSLVSAISAGGTAVTPEAGSTPGAAITINNTDSHSKLLISGSTVTTQAAATNGSNIVINGGGSLMFLTDSLVTASAVAGNGGNITINNIGSTALQRSAIVAQAGPGNGGAINIALKDGAVFVQDASSLVSATSKSGNNGTVTISSPQTDLNSALRTPDVSVARAPELSANVCRREGSHSTFVREGRGGVPPDPEGYLSAPGKDGLVTSGTTASLNCELTDAQ